MPLEHRLPAARRCLRWPQAPLPLALASGLLVLALAPRPAAADAVLTTAAGKPSLREAQFALDVHIDGVLAHMVAHQTLLNPGQVPEQAVYTFELPAQAAVTDVSIHLADGRRTSALLVDVDAALTLVADPDALTERGATPDPGLLRMIARDVPAIHDPAAPAMATYELRVYPVPPGRSVTVTTRWSMPLRYQDGRLILRVPGRGNADNLVREQVRLRLQPPVGVPGIGAVHGGGRALGTKVREARFMAPPRGDLVVDARLDFGRLGRGPSRGQPIALFSTAPIRDDLGALGLAVLVPPAAGAPRLSFERVLLIVDVSRSLGQDGLAAAATLADAMLAASPPNTQVEAILFDHHARAVLGGFTLNHHHTRKTLASALHLGALENGSDLGAALDQARALLRRQSLAARPGEGFERGGRASTLVAIVSDGMLPVELTAGQALDRLGADLLSDVELLSIVLVPDQAPVPDMRDGVLPVLAGKTGGRAMAVRFGESQARAATLATELAQPAPLTGLGLDIGPAIADRVALPRVLAPGEGVIAVGLYHGPAPRQVIITGHRQGVRPQPPDAMSLHLVARRDPSWSRAREHQAGAHGDLALALASAREDDFLRDGSLSDDAQEDPDALQTPGDAALEAARRLLVSTARRVSVVTPYSALVALDARDRFARERLALSRTWGPSAFFRLPPPPERMLDDAIDGFDWHVRPESRTGGGRGLRRTGELDRDIIAQLLDRHLIPGARACYEDALRHNPKIGDMHPGLTVIMELARGEVQLARVVRSTFPDTGSDTGMEACVTRAAYTIRVPRVALGDDPETIGVVRYPLRFRRSRGGSEVRSDGSAPSLPTLPTLPDALEGRGPLDGIE